MNKKTKSVHIRLDEETHNQLKAMAESLNIPLNEYISQKLMSKSKDLSYDTISANSYKEGLLQNQQTASENRQLFAQINQSLCDILLQLNQLKSVTSNLVSSLDLNHTCPEKEVTNLSLAISEAKKDILKSLSKTQDILNKFKN